MSQTSETVLVTPQSHMTLVKQETRALILEAAEVEFARRGFAAARLGDIAARVGITRAAVIYHFDDKQTLYDEVLAEAFAFLESRMVEGMRDTPGHSERVEAMVDAWIACSAERPTLARLFMREVADAEDGFRPAVERLVSPLFARILEPIEAGTRDGAFRRLDPVHLVTILAGATTWFATSSHLLGPLRLPSDPEHYASYREELMRVTRLLLGTEPTEDES